jgi:hypothetical protein
MPSPRSVLIDITEKNLDPEVPRVLIPLTKLSLPFIEILHMPEGLLQVILYILSVLFNAELFCEPGFSCVPNNTLASASDRVILNVPAEIIDIVVALELVDATCVAFEVLFTFN